MRLRANWAGSATRSSKRYYGGCQWVDVAEQIAIDRAKALFGSEFVNVQPHSGAQANGAVMLALLQPGEKVTFSVKWWYNINDRKKMGGRSGYEYFPEEDNYLYTIAQFFPRMCTYTDVEGWQNKQFIGRGEFTLEFGDYDVAITVPADHIVSSTGVLQNPNEVLTRTQRQRLAEAEDADSPVFIVTPEEAAENEKEGTDEMKTWRYSAENVRDFAWSSSRKFIWDAMGFRQDDAENPLVMAMSFYPNEAMPVWHQYSTEAVIHTMEVYNRFSFNYPYPTAQSVNAWERGGMEYPMITFNGYRPTREDAEDGEVTYSRRIKYGLIGVIIHEIGHIYFPMTVNSDERQWTWMDEGLNTFLQYYAEQDYAETYCGEQWTQTEDCTFPSRRGPAPNIVGYMRDPDQVPIMTESDLIHKDFGENAYAKPATGLNILREDVLGHEAFKSPRDQDHASETFLRTVHGTRTKITG